MPAVFTPPLEFLGTLLSYLGNLGLLSQVHVLLACVKALLQVSESDSLVKSPGLPGGT